MTTGYQYDAVGSRQQSFWSTGGVEPYGYYAGTNRLHWRQRRDVLGNDTVHVYGYNANGAQRSHAESYETPYESRLLRREEYGYSFRGLMNRARVQSVADGEMQPWQDWRYRYNAMGEREQKRLYASDEGVVPAPAARRSPWVYYLLGGNKQQLAVYHGQELDSMQSTCGDVGSNRVYLYPWEYITYGQNETANLITRTTGIKEYRVVDHLGSTRLVVSTSGTIIAAIDYAPFGEVIAETRNKVRMGFVGKENDKETGLSNHGVRQYEPGRGTFSSCDVLWESYRHLQPYNYSSNNPVILFDKNGLWIDWSRNQDPAKAEAAFVEAMEYLEKNDARAGALLRRIYNDKKEKIYVRVLNEGATRQDNEWKAGMRELVWTPHHGLEYTDENGEVQRESPAVVLGHEGGHAFVDYFSDESFKRFAGQPDAPYDNKEHRWIIRDIEWDAAVKTGEVNGGPRVDHKSGKLFRSKGVTSNEKIGY